MTISTVPELFELVANKAIQTGLPIKVGVTWQFVGGPLTLLFEINDTALCAMSLHNYNYTRNGLLGTAFVEISRHLTQFAEIVISQPDKVFHKCNNCSGHGKIILFTSSKICKDCSGKGNIFRLCDDTVKSYSAVLIGDSNG